jgi:small subunit ribosomal protein S8
MDPIANLLTSIRNAMNARQQRVEVGYSGIKADICQILKDLGIINNFKFSDNDNHKVIVVEISDNQKIYHLKRVSKPGRRLYVKSKDIRIPLSGIGNLIISTSAGLMEARKAKKLGLGGEIICEVW